MNVNRQPFGTIPPVLPVRAQLARDRRWRFQSGVILTAPGMAEPRPPTQAIGHIEGARMFLVACGRRRRYRTVTRDGGSAGSR